MVFIIHLAYIDPGSGSLVLQTIVGVGLGIAYAVRHRVRVLFGRLFPRRSEALATEDDTSENPPAA